MKLGIQWFTILCVCLILTIFPWPHFLTPVMPPWCLFLLFYTVVIWRASLGWLAIVTLGLMVDVLQGALLGQHVLAFSLSLWLTRIDPKLYYQPAMDRQVGWIGVVFFTNQLILFISNGILFNLFSWSYFMQSCISVILSTLLWPWLFLLLDAFFKSKPLPSPMRILE